MQIRFKWHKEDKNWNEGMFALLKNENLPRSKRILQTVPGRDDKLRVTGIETTTRTYVRYILKIAKLSLCDEKYLKKHST